MLRRLPSDRESSMEKSISICLPTPCHFLMCDPLEDRGSQSGHASGLLLLPPELRNNFPSCLLLLTQENRGDSRSSGQTHPRHWPESIVCWINTNKAVLTQSFSFPNQQTSFLCLPLPSALYPFIQVSESKSIECISLCVHTGSASLTCL